MHEARTRLSINGDTLAITPSSALDRRHAHDTPTSPSDVHLVEETDDLSCNVLASCLLVVHDTSRGCENNVSELTGRKELDNPLLEIGEADVVSGGDDTSLVEAAVQLDDNLARSVVVNLLEFTNVAVLLHDTEELDDDLGGRADQDLSLSGLLGVVDGIERIVED